MIRRSRFAAHAIILITALAGCGQGVEHAAVRSPNVILYMTDTLRPDSLQPYGNSRVATPAAMRLAREGTRFERVYAPSTWTRPSIASILTGVYPDVHGAERRSDSLGSAVSLLPEHFTAHGYTTACIVTNPNVGAFFGFDQGYDDFIELYPPTRDDVVASSEDYAPSAEVTRRAIEWIKAAERPFFLFILSIDPHWPYQPPKRFDRYGGDYAGRMNGGKRMLRSVVRPEDRRRVRSLYDGEVSYNDDSLGGLLDFLSEAGLARKTVLAFTSDHGEEFWEHGRHGHGHALFDETLRVPLILRYPPAVAMGKVVSQRIEAVDIFPTLLGLAGLPIPEAIDGRNLLRESDDDAREIYASLALDAVKGRSLLDPPWKLITLTRGKGSDTRLFNLEIDPQEKTDLAAKNPERVAAMKRRLSGLAEEHALRRADLVDATPPPGASPAEPPQSVLDGLRALGYLDDEKNEEDEDDEEE